MRRLLRTVSILILLGFGIGMYVELERIPRPKVKVPMTRYHGYAINAESINRAQVFTVLISNEGFGGVSRGTGVLIDPTHVLTCAHMLESGDNEMWLYPYPLNYVVKGRPVFVSTGKDLAVIELNRPVVIPHYAVFMAMTYPGEPITIIGNTLGSMKWFVTFGIISDEWDGFLLTDGVLYGGNSGGPWINEKGEVVALTDWTLLHKGEESQIHGGISAETINKFLKSWKDSQKNPFGIIMEVMQ